MKYFTKLNDLDGILISELNEEIINLKRENDDLVIRRNYMSERENKILSVLFLFIVYK